VLEYKGEKWRSFAVEGTKEDVRTSGGGGK